MNEELMSDSTLAQTAVLLVDGDLVAARLPAIRTRLREMVASGTRNLSMDLADTQLVDSAGIGLLISAHNSLKRATGGLTVIHASKDILELFRTMRIHKHFSVTGTKD